MSNLKGISGKAKVAGVMGWPVAHTRSPRLHGYWLSHHEIDGVYIPMPVPEGSLEQALRALPVLGFKGCNLTIPHKEAAMDIVDHIDPLAKRVGAVNTIIVRDDHTLEGRNTDVFGFMENMKAAGFVYNPDLPAATVIGAGGAARAIVVGLQEFGYKEIRIVNRSKERAEALAKSLRGKSKFLIYGLDAVEKTFDHCGLLVNSSSLGMEGHPPLVINLSSFPREGWVTDAVYAPLQTDLIKRAKQYDISTVDGLGMLLHQARAGFEAWFGTDPTVSQELRTYVLGET